MTATDGTTNVPADQGPAPESARTGEYPALRLWAVPHTHWDREWYLPFQQFRIHLARLVDDLMDALEQEPSLLFTFDGQAVILDDYLELRPEQERRLRAHLGSERIAVGPAYVLQDEFLVGQESLIRNLIVGRQVCERYGARPMGVFYAPDTFGHVAQLPQILRGFGIDGFVFWRGLGDEAERLGAAFQWRAPDGSEVLAVRLLGSYANNRDLGKWTREGPVEDTAAWPDTAARRVVEYLERFWPYFQRSGMVDVALANGNDHAPLQRDLLSMLAACKARLPRWDFGVATYEGYVQALRERVDGLDVHAGEMVGGLESCVVRSVNSTRIYLKQANEAAERELLVAEALAAMASLTLPSPPSLPSPQYPLAELRLAWRELLRNQPHDSLPGCSVDEVHREMEPRFGAARQIAQQVQREALAVLAGQRAGMRPWEESLNPRSLVNVLPWTRTGAVELELPAELREARRLVADTPEGPLPVQIAGRGGKRRAIVAARVPGFGAVQLRLLSGRGPMHLRGARSSGTAAIENQFYRVEAASNGSVAVTDRRTGETWAGLHFFQNVADRGDEYSFCPVAGDAPRDSLGEEARVRVRAGGPAVAELEIDLVLTVPRELRGDRRARSRATVACPIRTIIRLTSGVDRIEFRTTVANQARDHRLRVLFPAPRSDRFVRAEGHFAVLRRPAEPVWNGRWREPPTGTHHTLGMVAAGHLALFSRGLPEYEAVPNEAGGVDLALTLLRCVGWLSWSDLETRPGAEDPHLPTPDAQCLGSHTFEYAISLRGEASDAELVRAAQDYRVGIVSGPAGADLGGIPRIEGEGFAFSALKGAEDGNGVVLRLYNPGQEPALARVGGPGLAVRRCRMDETETETRPIGSVTLRAGELVTLRLRRES